MKTIYIYIYSHDDDDDHDDCINKLFFLEWMPLMLS